MKAHAREHIRKIKEMPCALCGEPAPSDAHHIREGMGMGMRNSDYLTIPLCKFCHQGDQGVHGDKTMLKIYKQDELSLLAATIRRLTDG